MPGNLKTGDILQHPNGAVFLITGYADRAAVPYWKAKKYDKFWSGRHVYEIRWCVPEQAYYYRKSRLTLLSADAAEAYLFELKLLELNDGTSHS